jgi:hypothetical protein
MGNLHKELLKNKLLEKYLIWVIWKGAEIELLR